MQLIRLNSWPTAGRGSGLFVVLLEQAQAAFSPVPPECDPGDESQAEQRHDLVPSSAIS
jgi:hypothetical protein